MARIQLRQDIQEAVDLLPPKAQRSLSRVRTLRKVIEQLNDFDQRVVAVAGATPPQVNMTDGASLAESWSVATDQRLLVVTWTSFWDMQTNGRLGGGGVAGREIPLLRVQDYARANTRRRASQFGLKQCILSFDHHRGAELETEVFQLASADALDLFEDRMNRQIDWVRKRAGQEQEQREAARAQQAAEATARALAEQQAGAPMQRPSRGEELERLGSLLERGLISREEFDALKEEAMAG